MARWAQTVTLQDFLDSACGEIDVEAAKKALAKGETLAGFLSRQAIAEESAAAAGGGGAGGSGGGPGTPPSLKQRITDSVSSPLTTLFSRGEPRPASSLKEDGGRTTGSAGEKGEEEEQGEGEGRKRQPTALELMFMEGPGGGEGGKGGGEGEVARGDEQV
jgi:hypothetical protein